jgi:two-component system sensor histidine kinase ChiS
VAKILVVDDHADSLTAMSLLLELEGYEVRRAASGAETLRLIERERPDLVLLDLYLPDMGGAEVCEILAKQGAMRELKVVIFSAAHETADEVRRALASGAREYLGKPFRAEELLARISALLGDSALA